MWILTSKSLPPEDVIVETKIDDEHGCRSQEYLKRIGALWFCPDNGVCVGYRPTHWRF